MDEARVGTGSVQASLLGLLETDLDELSQRVSSPQPVSVQLDFLAAKLRLHAIPLLSPRPPKTDHEAVLLTRAVWYSGFHVAMKIVNLFTNSVHPEPPRVPCGTDGETSQSRDTVSISYPKHYLRVLVVACMYLIKFLAIDPDIPAQDKLLTRNRIKGVYETLQGWSKNSIDELGRTARFLALLSRHAENKTTSAYFREQTPGSSNTLADDSMRIVRQLRQQQSLVMTSEALDQAPIQEAEVQSSTAEFEDLVDHSASILPTDMPSDWDIWLLNNHNDFMSFLGPHAGQASNDFWAWGR